MIIDGAEKLVDASNVVNANDRKIRRLRTQASEIVRWAEKYIEWVDKNEIGEQPRLPLVATSIEEEKSLRCYSIL